ncbi:hypothetical protein ACHHYP_00165 [Achlya hypogyna]|uniref:Uncharacterized protein n=1 Tax=Achlya hypogyna TaxID=1202772 RepID=A0A1V9ZB31_ACHHY|nr:hypothetical protein ACHHYP_00165 [Achlya hypogyna]
MSTSTRVRVCIVEGCDRFAKVHGTCLGHVRSKGVLPPLAALVSRVAKKRPVCVRLKNRNRQCAAEGCLAYARRGGYCTKHGGGRKCSIDGCGTTAQAYGICRLHGGGARCKTPGCTQFARAHGVCGLHAKDTASPRSIEDYDVHVQSC